MTTEITTTPEFLGIYGISEVARFLGVTPPLANGRTVESAKLRYWIRTTIHTEDSLALPIRPRPISFRDLISMRLIAVLRLRGVTLREVREAEDWMRANLHIDWPFISRPLWTFASDVYIEFEHHLINASRFGQRAMDFIREWLSTVELDMAFDENDLVESWTPYTDIQIDPKVQLGEPCIGGTRIPTNTIRGKIQAGDSPEVVARLYDLTKTQIQHAIAWGERLDAAQS